MAGVGLRFALLGPMEMADQAGQLMPVPGTRQRVLLAALLLSANAPVSCDELYEAVWDGSPPAGAAATLRSHIRRLRNVLDREAAGRIIARAPGYLICVQQMELDVLQFEAFCREAGTARRTASWAEVSAAASHALELWRGTPLLDVPSQMLRDRAMPRLEQMRLQALEDHAEAELRLQQHDRLITGLRDLTAQHPLRERFHCQLMEALARSGRRAEALDAYGQARQALADELGIEPGPELQSLRRKILAGDPVLLAPVPQHDGPPLARSVTSDPEAPVVPRQLPAAVPDFIGRNARLADLTAVMNVARADGTGVMIAAIDGAPGVGKTALAVRWAHQVAADFPDGQLYVNLRGFDPSGRIVSAETAVRGFVDAFGVPPEHIPSSPEALAALYRSLLVGKRVLVLADNARDAGQVRPLLPGSAECLVVVTSRARLTGLAAAEGARLLTLDILQAGEARQLLSRRIGADRATAEPTAIAELAALCGRLPLALTVAGAQAAARPGTFLKALTAQLANAAGRLQALETADPATDVRTVFSWSYQALEDLPARMFRLLGVHSGPDVTIPAAAALLAVRRDEARAALSTLAMANLIDEHAPGRYSMHDLLRAYAREQAGAVESEADQESATRRVLDFYLHTAHAAALLLNPSRAPIALALPQPGVLPEVLADGRQALAWFEAEHNVLLSAVTQAAETRYDACACQLPWAIADFLDRRGHWLEWAATERTALAAATGLGDTPAQTMARRRLAHACMQLGDYDQARAHLTGCLDLYQRLGDRSGQARTHQSLGVLDTRQGQHADALVHDQQALELVRTAGNRAALAAALSNVGHSYAHVGNYEQARAFCRQSLDLHRQLDYSPAEANAWDSLGYAEHKLGNLTEAVGCYTRALAIFRDLGDRYSQADILIHLGDVREAARDMPGAQDAWQQALNILEDLHHPDAAKVRAKLRHPPAMQPRDTHMPAT